MRPGFHPPKNGEFPTTATAPQTVHFALPPSRLQPRMDTYAPATDAPTTLIPSHSPTTEPRNLALPTYLIDCPFPKTMHPPRPPPQQLVQTHYNPAVPQTLAPRAMSKWRPPFPPEPSHFHAPPIGDERMGPMPHPPHFPPHFPPCVPWASPFPPWAMPPHWTTTNHGGIYPLPNAEFPFPFPLTQAHAVMPNPVAFVPRQEMHASIDPHSYRRAMAGQLTPEHTGPDTAEVRREYRAFDVPRPCGHREHRHRRDEDPKSDPPCGPGPGYRRRLPACNCHADAYHAKKFGPCGACPPNAPSPLDCPRPKSTLGIPNDDAQGI